MKRIEAVCLTAVLLAAAGTALAQDSVSKAGTGDAVAPWNPVEQANNYVLDLTPFTTSWNNEFGIAPLIKSSKTSTDYFSSLISAQGASVTLLHDQDYPGGPYSYWGGPGFGINDDPAINDAGTPVVPDGLSTQFGVAFAEYATDDALASYNGVINGVVNFNPEEPAGCT